MIWKGIGSCLKLMCLISFLIIIITTILCMMLCGGYFHALICVCRGQRTNLAELSPPSTVTWIPGIELGSSWLPGKPPYMWNHLTSLMILYLISKKCSSFRIKEMHDNIECQALTMVLFVFLFFFLSFWNLQVLNLLLKPQEASCTPKKKLS